MKSFLLFHTFCCMVFIVSFCHSVSQDVKDHYKDFLAGNGLYSQSDKITILTASNLTSVIFGTKNAWLVQFYNSWCGHCINFAPTYKALGADLYGWSTVIKLAAIDCSAEVNTPACRDFEIMSYPTLKVFSAQSPTTNMGVEFIKKPNLEDIERGLVGVLQREQLEGSGTHWPNITPYRNSDVSHLWSHQQVRYIFLIFEEETSSLGTEVLLDLSSVEDILIRTVLPENEVLARLMGIHTYPSLVLIDRTNSEPQRLHPEHATRKAFRQTIKSYLEANGVTVPEEPQELDLHQAVPDVKDLIEVRKEMEEIREMKALGDVVFLVDLDNTLRYSLQQEVPLRKAIKGDALEALNNFLGVLAKYFPVGEAGIQFLQNLRDSVFQEKELRGLRFKSMVSGLDAVLSTKEKWAGCRPSEGSLRGYPCGLWTLFHYMTVSALRDSDHVHYDPMEVLQAMLGYITYFFGCSQCSKHFQEMANKSLKAKVTDGQQAVLWLWSAHNQVNTRLAGDASEDPMFPKVQFPSQEHCPKCKDSTGRWDEGNILKYLTNMYHQDSLNYKGSNTKLSSPNESDFQGKKASLVADEQLNINRRSGKEFTIFDMSICVMLYVVCGIICVGVCLKFIIRKRYRKKAYIHDLQGKV